MAVDLCDLFRQDVAHDSRFHAAVNGIPFADQDLALGGVCIVPGPVHTAAVENGKAGSVILHVQAPVGIVLAAAAENGAGLSQGQDLVIESPVLLGAADHGRLASHIPAEGIQGPKVLGFQSGNIVEAVHVLAVGYQADQACLIDSQLLGGLDRRRGRSAAMQKPSAKESAEDQEQDQHDQTNGK